MGRWDGCLGALNTSPCAAQLLAAVVGGRFRGGVVGQARRCHAALASASVRPASHGAGRPQPQRVRAQPDATLRGALV